MARGLALVPLKNDWTLPPLGDAFAVAVSAALILVPLGAVDGWRCQMQLIQLLKSPVTVAVLAVFHDLTIARRPKGALRKGAGGSGEVSYPAFEAGDEVLQEVQRLTGDGRVPAGPVAQWAGLWRVSYAPHIRTLGSVGLTRRQGGLEFGAAAEIGQRLLFANRPELFLPGAESVLSLDTQEGTTVPGGRDPGRVCVVTLGSEVLVLKGSARQAMQLLGKR
eukprot:Skav207732  [mRNA]  locus=scaffold362:290967:298462:- [translate_table: standard]